MNADVVTGELVPTPAPESRTLFRTDDPAEVLQAARQVATALEGALKDGGMMQRIGDNDHVRIDGWQTLGSMLGIAPYVVWSRPIEGGWEARAEARTADGRTVGAAEAMCTHQERNWARSDEYALRSMAQTRAMSKALRGPLGFIITLAGHNATPAEEVGHDAFGPVATPREVDNLKRAIVVLIPSITDTRPLVERLEKDAGDYLPRIVARAMMLAAAHRPTPAGTAPDGGDGTGVEESATEDTPAPDDPAPVDPQPQEAAAPPS